MAIKIPGWIAKSWKYFTSAAGAAAATALVLLMPDSPDNYARQIIVGMDSTVVIVGTDTTKHATTEADLSQKYRAADEYDNGYRLHVWTYKTINTLTGEVTPEMVLTFAPPIGCQVNWKARAGKAEIAEEKIPEKLETLPADKAQELGWYPVMDTVEISDKGAIELKKRWSTDTKAVRLEYDAKAVAEPVAEVEAVK